MSEVDITELARIKYRCLSILPFTSSCCLISLLSYLTYRIKCIWDTYAQGVDGWTWFGTCLYLFAELGILCKLFNA